MSRLAVLDGWRGLSILLVLATHLLPLKHFARLDAVSATAGMALFFCLSGYLIAAALHSPMSIRAFFARRLARVVPLAWLYLLVVVLLQAPPASAVWRNFLFVANLPPQAFLPQAEHFWSLCTEVQFYVLIGLLWAVLKRRTLWVVAVTYVALVAHRHVVGHQASSITLYRVDEILAGFLLYAALHAPRLVGPARLVFSAPLWLPGLLLLLACSVQLWTWNSFRSLACAWLVGCSVYQSQAGTPRLWLGLLQHRLLAYCATTSYALYVIHPLLTITWLGAGDLIEKYSKRPLLLLVLFVLAHLSTRYLEPVAMRWARRVH